MCEKLHKYCLFMGISDAEAAASLDCHEETFRLWRLGKSVPRADKMKLIFEWSYGYVSPNDFYNLPKLSGSGPDKAELDPVVKNQIDMFQPVNESLAGVSS